MTKPIEEHEGKKYLRLIWPCGKDVVCDPKTNQLGIYVDVYAVIEAFGVTCPARQHALKKLLCCGNRNKGTELADLVGVEAAVARAIQLQNQRDRDKEQAIKVAEKKK